MKFLWLTVQLFSAVLALSDLPLQANQVNPPSRRHVPSPMRTLYRRMRDQRKNDEGEQPVMVKGLFPKWVAAGRSTNEPQYMFSVSADALTNLTSAELHYLLPTAGCKAPKTRSLTITLGSTSQVAPVLRGWRLINVGGELKQQLSSIVGLRYECNGKARRFMSAVRKHEPFLLLFYGWSGEANSRSRRAALSDKEIYTASELQHYIDSDKPERFRKPNYASKADLAPPHGERQPAHYLVKRRRKAVQKGAKAASKNELPYPDDYRGPRSETKAERRRRKRRRKEEEKSRKPISETACQRRSMIVDFAQVGWRRWVVAPAAYEAFTCSGNCSYPIDPISNPTNHALLQSLTQQMNLNKEAESATPASQCVPIKYDSYTLLFYNAVGQLVLRNYPNMVVNECGCR